ncbi:MAG: AtpZ/AtpI family protein [Candidatus Omnitrophica bacterium]|nr:AtpZ/AtpI family protein [Candidatus Omnitrophota bacterium]
MTEPGDKKTLFYKWLKIGGLLSFIPVVLAAGPLGGYFIGSFLEKRFGLGYYVSLGLTAIGFLASAWEAVRIVRLALKTDEKSPNG